MAWRLARSLTGLRDEVNRTWPNRSKASDGTVGDLAHQNRSSGHNPNAAGVVTALDITAAGIDIAWYAEHLRTLGAAGHPALRSGGYVIYNRRICSAKSGWRWVTYNGTNPHIKHCHCSVGTTAAAYDSTSPWGITNRGDDFMSALTDAEQRELLTRMRKAEEYAASAKMMAEDTHKRCIRLETSIHGVDDDTRNRSIFFRVKYLFSELLDSGNNLKLRQILALYGHPDVQAAIRKVDAEANPGDQ